MPVAHDDLLDHDPSEFFPPCHRTPRQSFLPTTAYGYEVQAYQAVAVLNPNPTTIRNLSYSPE